MPHLFVSAGPGTGKTYTGTNIYKAMMTEEPIKASIEQHMIFDWCCNNLPSTNSWVFLAAGRAIADSLDKRTPKDVKCYSIHGLGYSQIIRKHKHQTISSNRGRRLLEDVIGKRLSDLRYQDRRAHYGLLKFIEKLKLELLPISSDSFEYLQDKYPALAESSLPEDHLDLATRTMNLMKEPNRFIEYVDQLWMGIQCTSRPRFKIGVVDEFQDLSAAQLELCIRACENCIFLGDPNQAINAFAGARQDSIDKIRSISSTELPLKLSFRCPPNIIEKANRLKPEARLRCPETKTPGTETRLPLHDLPSTLEGIATEQALLVCRRNAPLFAVWAMLAKEGIISTVLGTDVVKNLENYIKYFKASSPRTLLSRVQEHSRSLSNHHNPLVQMESKERCEIITTLCEGALEIPDVIENLRLALSPKPHSYRLSTIHKAKGLEAPHVFILFPPIEHPLALKNPHTGPQETNLHFVAITRTSRNLYWVVE